VLKKEYPFGAIFSSTGGDALIGSVCPPNAAQMAQGVALASE
jgi:hypothetical protein